MLRVTIVYLFFTIANTSFVLLTTNSKEGNNMFCPGEPIIVKCSVRGLGLRWHIGGTLVIFGKTDADIFAGPYNEGQYSYIESTYGRLNIYQNGSYVGSTSADSTLNSELHMHLEDANDFIEVTCKEFLNPENDKTINITVIPGMLIME